MTKVRSGYAGALALIAAFMAYIVLGGSLPAVEERFPPKPVQVSPATDKDSVRVKLAVIINGSESGGSPDVVSVWYLVDGQRYPGGRGNYQTKRYWWRVLEVKRWTDIRLEAKQKTPGQQLDVFIYKYDVEPGEARVLAHDSIVGPGAIRCAHTVR